MPFQRPLSGLASALAAVGLVLAVAGCSHVTPLGPDPAPVSLPPAHQLGSPISVQVIRSQPPTAAGRCPAGSVRPLRVAAQRAAGLGSAGPAPSARPREHGHRCPDGHAGQAGHAARGRRVLPAGRQAGNGHFRCSLLGHHLPEPAGARRIRIRGRLSHRRRGGVDRSRQAGPRRWRCHQHQRRRQALAGSATTTEDNRTPGGPDHPAQPEPSRPALPPAGPLRLIAAGRRGVRSG